MSMVKSGGAFCVAGNHDVKLVRALRGKDVKKTHGLAESLDQLAREPDEFRKQAAEFLNSIGVAAFALKYRLPNEEKSPYTIENVRQDAYRAMLRSLRTATRLA